MVWNVYVRKSSADAIEVYNIFDHGGFAAGVKKIMNKKLPKEEFEEKLRRALLYYFWAKSEWEITIAQSPAYIKKDAMDELIDEMEKYKRQYGHYPYAHYVKLKGSIMVDVYSQVRLNWTNFVDYVWSKI